MGVGRAQPPESLWLHPRHPTVPHTPAVVAGGGGDPASGALTSFSREGPPPTPANPRPSLAPHPKPRPTSLQLDPSHRTRRAGTGCSVGSRRAPHSCRGPSTQRRFPDCSFVAFFLSPPRLQAADPGQYLQPVPTAYIPVSLGLAHSRSRFPRKESLGRPTGLFTLHGWV